MTRENAIIIYEFARLCYEVRICGSIIRNRARNVAIIIEEYIGQCGKIPATAWNVIL